MTKSFTLITLIFILSILTTALIVTHDPSINHLKLQFDGKEQQILIEVKRDSEYQKIRCINKV